MTYVDTHFHVYLEGFKTKMDPISVVEDSLKSDVKTLWLASTSLVDLQKNLELCKKYPRNLKTFAGFHPEGYLGFDEKSLEELVSKNLDYIVGVGEIGIELSDYYVSEWEKLSYSKETIVKEQQRVFTSQIDLAEKYSLPFAVHSRNGFAETIEILEQYKNTNFIWHCYNLKKAQTLKLLHTFPYIYFGFNNIINYKSGKYIEESIKVIPKERLLPETDAPFLAPRPFNKEYNTPEGVLNVYKKLSELLHISEEELCFQIMSNVKNYTSKK